MELLRRQRTVRIEVSSVNFRLGESMPLSPGGANSGGSVPVEPSMIRTETPDRIVLRQLAGSAIEATVLSLKTAANVVPP